MIGFKLTNKGEKRAVLGCFGAGTGEIQLFISEDGQNYLEYEAGWGGVDAICKNVIAPEGKLETSYIKVLWNRTIKGANISASTLKYAREGKLLSEYAFPEAGVYFIKITAAEYGLSSEPVQINIDEPTGDDLIIWNKIKDREDIAYFIQTSSLQTVDPELRTKFQREIEELVSKYPNSLLTGPIRQSLETFRVYEEKRKARPRNETSE